MIQFTRNELDGILGEFLGKPYAPGSSGPNSYDCYGFVKAFTKRIGIDLPEIGIINPKDSRKIYEQEQTNYIELKYPRPWSLITFSGKDLNAHIGVVLPGQNNFIHCPGRAAGKVISEPLNRRPWRDSVDGYWWPKNVVEVVIMLTPMTNQKIAWQFVPCGHSVRQIVTEDLNCGQSANVDVFVDGEKLEESDWNWMPMGTNQIVVRPRLGQGDQIPMMAGMLALAVFAPYAAGAIVGKTAGLAYHLWTAGIMMAGGIALNALVGPNEGDKDKSQSYSWDPATTQQVGSLIPSVYGTFGVRGNIICSYAKGEYTTDVHPIRKNTRIRNGKDVYYFKVAYSDGPIDGIVDGTERVNDKDPEQLNRSDNFLIEHFTGTCDQAASSVPDGFEVPVNQLCDDPTNGDNEVTTTFNSVASDSVAVVLRFPNSFGNWEKDGSLDASTVDIRIRIREIDGAWHTLMDTGVSGLSKTPVRLLYYFDETYDGGSPFTIEADTSYEVEVLRQNSRHSDHGDDFYFDCIQFGFDTAQKHPGLAYTAIAAAAASEISGQIEYYAVIKGKLVRVYDDEEETWSVEWSDNPAWVAFDILTRPVFSADNEVDYYRRIDPDYLNLSDFVEFADWCDELVPDDSGVSGSTEKRFVFNGILDEEGTAWDQAVRVCKMAHAALYFSGHKVRIAIDKPATPTQMFCVSNLRDGFSETWINSSEAATEYDVQFANEDADYTTESYTIVRPDAEYQIPATLDGFGHTKRSQVWRFASRHLRINQYLKRVVELPAALDAIYCSIGDVVYVQHPSLQRASGGRIVEVYADGILLDKDVESTESGADYALLVRTHDGSDEHLTLYEVNEVTGESGRTNAVTINGVWEYTPNVDDLWVFGEETKVIDLYRITGFTRYGDGKVLIQAAQYSTDYYAEDEDAPVVEAEVYSTTKGGKSPSLLPTTKEALAASGPAEQFELDTLVWVGFTFTGDAIDTVTWSCDSGAGIRYDGIWCPIEEDLVGTTDKYIYFDPAIGDPRYFEHTNDLADLVGEERYVFCINEGGIAYFQPGRLMTPDDTKLDELPSTVTTFYYQATEPTSGMVEGDYWQDSDDKKWYRYSGSAWVDVQDADIAQALSDASDAQATADGKIVTFAQAAEPTAEAEGDLWIDTDDANKMYRWSGAAWVSVRDTDIAQAISDAAGAQSTADGKVTTFYQDGAPTAEGVGDLWIDTDDGNKLYRWSGAEWVEIQDDDIAQAIADAGVAEAIADGKIVSHYGSAPPLVAHYKLNDNAADTDVVDATGNGHDGAATENTSGLSTTGKIGTALQFAIASAQYVKITDHADLRMDSTGGTVCCWVKWDGDFTDTGGSHPRIWARSSYTGLMILESNGRLTGQAGGANFSTDSSQGVVSGTWVHVAVVFDPVAGTRRIYVNGVDKTTSGVSGPMPASTAYDFFLAARTAGNGYFGGVIDDFRVYSRALTRGEILKLYNGGDGTEEVKVPDRGDLWIKSSEDNKPYQWNGSAWVAAGYDVATWAKVVGTGKPSDNADVTADSPIDTFRETFENPNDDFATRWYKYGNGSYSIVAEAGVAGGKVLRAGDNSGDDGVNIVYNTKIPYDPSKLYRMRVRVRRTAGSGTVYAGVYTYLNTGEPVPSQPNGSSGHFICMANEAVSSDWTVFTCYFTGHSANGTAGVCPDPASPGALKTGSAYFVPKAFLNYSKAAGVTDVDEIAIDIIPENADQIAESSTKKWAGESGADVTAAHATSILFRQDTEPADPQEGWTWWDTSGDPVLIKQYDGAEWVTVGVDIQQWLHDVDQTKLDGQHIYPQSVTTDKLAANSVTASKILVDSLSSICAYIGTLVGGSITGITLTGGTIKTATSGRRIQIDSSGLIVVTSDTAGKYGTFKYGDGTKYGSGQLARVGDTATGIPFVITHEQTVADFRFINRANDPTGAAHVGDVAVVAGELKICTVAGTPGTWTVVGTQS